MLVYKITNNINGKSYIGITSRTLTIRWHQHIYDATNEYRDAYDGKFQRAIRKYGAENFTVEVLEDNITDRKVLEQKEIEYIALYNTYYNGYNSTFGGEMPNLENARKPVCKLSPNGELLERYESIAKAAEENNLHASNISVVCSGSNNTSGGFVWCFEEDLESKLGKTVTLPVGKTKIIQYDKNGNYVRCFDSIREAEQVTKISSADISRVVNGKRNHAGNYVWRKFDTEDFPRKLDIKVVQLNYNKVCQYDLNDNLIAEFDSVADAARATGISSNGINKVCRGFMKTSGGYKWSKEYK